MIVCLHPTMYKRLRLEMPDPYTYRVGSGDETRLGVHPTCSGDVWLQGVQRSSGLPESP